jgi:rod shape-determining protein MreB
MFTLSPRIGIDLGTMFCRVWVQGKGIVLEEPSVVATDLRARKVVAVGQAAKNMVGRNPGSIQATQPIRQGVISDYAVTEAMLRLFLQQAMGRSVLFKPEVMISVPSSTTQVERHAVLEAVLSAGARKVYLIDQPLAAIIGAGLPIAEASGNMVIQLGGGVSEAAVVSLGGVVSSGGVRVGGSAMNEAIQHYMKKMHAMVVGEATAEHIRSTIGWQVQEESEKSGKKEQNIEVKGRSVVEGMPQELMVRKQDLVRALFPQMQSILQMVKSLLGDMPPELASDVIDKGVVLSGGLAELPWCERFFATELGVPATVAEKPAQCAIRGISLVLGDLESYRHVLSERV